MFRYDSKKSSPGFICLTTKTDRGMDIDVFFDNYDVLYEEPPLSANFLHLDGHEFDDAADDVLSQLYVFMGGKIKTIYEVIVEAENDFREIMKEIKGEAAAEYAHARSCAAPSGF